MAVVLYSLLKKKPLRQDVAMTGEIQIGPDNAEIRITAIGGVHEKIKAAERWGFKKVLIPASNYKVNIDPKDYNLEVVGCSTLDEYLSHVLVDRSSDPRIHYMIEGKIAQ